MPAAATDENVEKKIFAFRSMASAFRETRSRLLGNDVIQEVTDNGKVNGPPLPHITLHQAARDGDVEMMERLLARVPQLQFRKRRLNQRDENKFAPIHYAARYNRRNMMEYLIKNGANVQSVTDDDSTALHIIAKYKKNFFSMEHDANIKKENHQKENHSEKENETDQEDESEHLSCVELLVQNGAQVNAKDASGQTPLHLSCARGNVAAVEQLLACQGIAIEMSDKQGMTALHLACLNGHSDVVRTLIEAGANMRSRDKEMTTPMHFACSEGSIEIATILYESADQHQIDNDSRTSSPTSVVSKGLVKSASMKSVSSTALRHIIQPSDSYQTIPLGTISAPVIKHVGGVVLLLDIDGERNLPLHLAVENGHANLITFCIEKSKAADLGSMVTNVRSSNYSCLHLAVQANSMTAVELLLNEGADINATTASLMTPLYLACQQNSHMIVEYLLERGCDVEIRDADYMTPFLVASRYGHLETLSWLLEYKVNVSATDKDDKTCLMWAAEENRPEAIRLPHNAVACKFSPWLSKIEVEKLVKSLGCIHKFAALAACNVKLLMENKEILSSIDEREKSNNTALHLAAMKGHSEVVKLLLEYEASAQTKNDSDKNALHMAALHGHHIIVEDLVEREKSILSGTDEEANTALHLAAVGGHTKCVTSLIELGANIELRNTKQWTPLDCACAFGFVKPAKALLEAGATIEPSGKIKISPLHLACQRGHVEVVNLLLEWKADVSFRSIDDRNALDYAIDFSQRSCVLTLIKHKTWKESLKNAYVDSASGHFLTPIRKLIMKMEDMAEIVCNQCISDNGKKPDDDDFAITASYELIDDVYSASHWVKPLENENRSFDDDCTVYYESGQVTKEAYAYHNDPKVLHHTHPLELMVRSKNVSLLKHPVVTALLHYKWGKFGRYFYYTGLLFYLVYLILLNVYMQQTPFFYQIDWVKMISLRKGNSENVSPESPASIQDLLSNSTQNVSSVVNFSLERTSAAPSTSSSLPNSSLSCIYYREELWTLPHTTIDGSCYLINRNLIRVQWALFAFSIVSLVREVVQLLIQRIAYVTPMNLVVVILYVLSLLVTLNTQSFYLAHLHELTKEAIEDESELQYLEGLQQQTGLRQQWQLEIGAFAVFLSWIVLLLFIQKLPKLGIFVVMFTDVLKTFLEFFIVLLLFTLGFALAFHILFGNRPVFYQWYWSIITTGVMMVGEINYSDMFFGDNYQHRGENYFQAIYAQSVSVILMVIFVIVMTIIIMNLLVGLAVGDIMQVQENATLERFRMQVGLTLEAEYSLPEFIRKKFCRGKETIEVNKYRKSNFLVRLLFENPDLKMERISDCVDKEMVEQSDNLSDLERILSTVDTLKNRVNDLLSEVSDVKDDVSAVRGRVNDVKREVKKHAEDIKGNVQTTNDELTEKIKQSHSSQVQTTHHESSQTRVEVDSAKNVVGILMERVENSRIESRELIRSSEKRLLAMQEQALQHQWTEFEANLAKYHETVVFGRQTILQAMEEVKGLVREHSALAQIISSKQ